MRIWGVPGQIQGLSLVFEQGTFNQGVNQGNTQGNTQGIDQGVNQSVNQGVTRGLGQGEGGLWATWSPLSDNGMYVCMHVCMRVLGNLEPC